MEKEKKQEVVIYGILWFVILTIVPVIMFFQGYTMRIPFRFGDLLHIWLGILPFFVLFLFHDFLATPLLLERGGRYFGAANRGRVKRKIEDDI